MLDLGSLVEISIILDIVNHKKTHWIKKKIKNNNSNCLQKAKPWKQFFAVVFASFCFYVTYKKISGQIDTPSGKFRRSYISKHLSALKEMRSRDEKSKGDFWNGSTNFEFKRSLNFRPCLKLEKRAEFPSWSGWRLCRVHKKWFVLGSTPSIEWKKLYPRSQSLGLLINLLKRLHLFNDGKKYNTFIRYPFIICCWHNSLCAIALINQLIKQTFNKPTIKLTTKYII